MRLPIELDEQRASADVSVPVERRVRSLHDAVTAPAELRDARLEGGRPSTAELDDELMEGRADAVAMRNVATGPLVAPLRIAAVGGGTGLPQVLAGLCGIRTGAVPLEVSAIVTTCDDGGSSGELRRRYGVPAPGDIRNCLVALAPPGSPLATLFQHRFAGDGGLAGHTVGNVVLTALAQQCGDFGAAVRAAGELLHVKGRVIPAIDGTAELVAALDDGRVVRGESAIAAARGRVGRLELDGAAAATRAAVEAIEAADLVVLGPGSLYSSVIAALLAEGVGAALAATRAYRVLVVNLFSQPGETDGYDAADHVQAIEHHVGRIVDAVLVHEHPLAPALVASYAAQGSHPVTIDRDALAQLGVEVIEGALMGSGEIARHDPSSLASALVDLVRELGPRPRREA
ncbi:MAG TPA: gluconeogenesis factor YvcK family protein [Anaeromyxobacteraceae bacterium]|nr:gluconeogenesis factor YvcK family protein [Anaeromyxobacteraceae bacterium]